MPAIELIKQPPTVALLNDGIRFQAQSNANFDGGHAGLHLRMPQDYSVYLDNSFTLSFMGRFLELTFKTQPDESGLQLTAWEQVNTYAVFIEKALKEINHNYEFNQNYIAVLDQDEPNEVITLRAKNFGEEYNISLLATSIDGLVVDEETIGVESSIPSDYRIYFAPYVWKSESPIFSNANGRELKAIDENQVSKANLAEYLDLDIQTQFTYPFNGIICRILPKAVLKYYIKYAEYFGGQTKLLRSTYDSPRYAIRGGLNATDTAFLNGDDYNYFDYQDNFKRFLNHAPTTKITYADVPELLYFLITTTGNVLVKFKRINTDQSEETITVQTIEPGNDYKILEINCGISDLLLDLNLNGVFSYEIWLEDDKGELLSETRTFILDHNEYLNKRVLFFQNSFDLYETICCTGDLKVTDKFKRKTVEISKDLVFKRKLSSVYHEQVYKLSTSWLESYDYRLWLTEVLMSKDTFYMLGHILLPVIITNKEEQLKKDRDHLYSLTFDFTPDFRETRFSSIVGSGIYFLQNEDGVILLNENNIGLVASL